MSNNHSTFSRISIIFKFDDGNSISRVNRAFEDSGLIITGDYLIVTTEKSDGVVSTVFKLKDITEYKTYNNITK
jgi:hypothetical protein